MLSRRGARSDGSGSAGGLNCIAWWEPATDERRDIHYLDLAQAERYTKAAIDAQLPNAPLGKVGRGPQPSAESARKV